MRTPSMRSSVGCCHAVASDEAAVAKQREIFEAQLLEDPKPKPEKVWPKIIEGKINNWFKETVLIDQDSAQHAKKTIDGLCQELGLGENQVVAIAEDAPGACLDIKLALLSALPSTNWTQFDRALFKEHAGRLVPLSASFCGRHDPIVLWCNRLCEQTLETSRNLLVLHVTGSSWQDQLEHFRGWEREHGTSGPLPTVFVIADDTSSAEIVVEPERCSATLRSPVLMRDLLQAMQAVIAANA